MYSWQRWCLNYNKRCCLLFLEMVQDFAWGFCRNYTSIFLIDVGWFWLEPFTVIRMALAKTSRAKRKAFLCIVGNPVV